MPIPSLTESAVRNRLKTMDLKPLPTLERMDQTTQDLPNHFFMENDIPDVLSKNRNVAYRNLAFFCEIYTTYGDSNHKVSLPIDILITSAINILGISNEEFPSIYEMRDLPAIHEKVMVIFNFANEHEHNYHLNIMSGKPLEIH